jgi:amino acid transporter
MQRIAAQGAPVWYHVIMSKLSLFSAVLLTVGAMVGSAIFSLTGLTILSAGSGALLSWLIAGLILLGFGFVTVSLARRFSISGGMFHFPALAFGGRAIPQGYSSQEQPEQAEQAELAQEQKFAYSRRGRAFGWLGAWIHLFGCIAGVAFSAVYLAEYLQFAFPALAPYTKVLSLLAVLLSLGVNLLKIEQMGKINATLTALLVVALLGFAIYLTSHAGFAFAPSQQLGAPSGQGGGMLAILSEVPVAALAYGAIVVPAFMVGSIKNAHRNAWLAMLLAMLVTMFVYCFAIFASLGFVSADYLGAHPEFVYAPFTAALLLAGAPSWAITGLNLAAVLALFTTMLVVSKLGATSIEQASKTGILPSKFLGGKGADIITALITFLVVTFYNKAELIVNSGVLFTASFTVLICLSALKLAQTPAQRIMPVVVACGLLATYIPNILTGGLTLWVVTVAYLLVGAGIFLSTQGTP